MSAHILIPYLGYTFFNEHKCTNTHTIRSTSSKIRSYANGHAGLESTAYKHRRWGSQFMYLSYSGTAFGLDSLMMSLAEYSPFTKYASCSAVKSFSLVTAVSETHCACSDGCARVWRSIQHVQCPSKEWRRTIICPYIKYTATRNVMRKDAINSTIFCFHIMNTLKTSCRYEYGAIIRGYRTEL